MSHQQRLKGGYLSSKRVLGAAGVVAWLVLAAVIQDVLSVLTVETYVSVVLAGLYVIYESVHNRHVSELWRRRFSRLLGLATVLYVGYALYRVVTLLPSGLQLS